MTDTNTDPNYQDILNKYSQDLANNNSDPEIPQNPPEPESAPLTEVEPTLVEEPVNTLDSPPSDLPPTFPQPEPQLQPEPQPQPEPVASNPIIDTEIPSESINPPPETPKSNNFFKYLFFFSLIIFIIVLVLVVISFLNSQKPISNSREVPVNNDSPTSAPTDFCELNEQKYLIGATFTADDGCNTCTCGEDLTISCTEKTCDASNSATTSAIPADWKTYSNQIYNVSLQYPSSFSVSDELPKTKTQGGPKTALEFTDTENNYQISIIIDPAGFGPIFADKKITLDYSPSKGLFSTKVIPSAEEDKQYLSPDKKALWYQFDSNSLLNLTIITNAAKTDTKLETITTQILSTFKFL